MVDEFDDGIDPDFEQDRPNDLRKQLKAKTAENADLRAQLDSQRDLALENAILKTGHVGLNETQLKAVAATHSGEMTPEAISATVASLGWASKVESLDVPDPDATALQRVSLAAQGANPGGKSSDDEWRAALHAASSNNDQKTWDALYAQRNGRSLS